LADVRNTLGNNCAEARRGSIYVAVLGVATIIALITMAAIHLARNEVLVLAGSQQMAQAELLSQSAVEFAICRIKSDVNWRTTFTSGTEVPSGSSWTSLGTGSFKFVVTDADGNLANDPTDVVTVCGIGKAGLAIQEMTVELEPTGTALDCLSATLHSGDDMDLKGQTLVCDRVVSCNGDIKGGPAAKIIGDAWATGTKIDPTVTGSKLKSQSPARQMPNVLTLWDYYLANGTAIDITSVPSQIMERVVLSAASNPYGEVNPQGIYIIDTQGLSLTIQDVRIVGTLVVISPAATTHLSSLINWSSQTANYPALLVAGDLSMEWSGGTSLSEATAATNFNPVGTPFNGVTDSDMADTYPGIIKGMIYCAGQLTTTARCVMQGNLVVGGKVDINADMTIAYGAAPATYPPPGFATGNVMRVIPRTFKRVAQ
jgi:hypothetical protein